MSPEILFGIGVVALVVIGLLGRLVPKRMPPSKAFTCCHCGVQALHTSRTEDAWRSGKKKTFLPVVSSQVASVAATARARVSRNERLVKARVPRCHRAFRVAATRHVGCIGLCLTVSQETSRRSKAP